MAGGVHCGASSGGKVTTQPALDSGAGSGQAIPGSDAATGGPGAADASVDTSTDTSASTGDRAWRFRTQVITEEHRSVPGKMFGGWGPHLGHMVRVGAALYFVDDACAPGSCDVNVDARLDYWKIGASTIDLIGSVSLPGGVQQNMGTVGDGTTLWSYGVAVAGQYLTECASIAGGAAAACNALPVDIGPNANYVGAAIHPGGSRMTWLTNVVDGGGGSFRFYANYGGGWNGPRLGAIGGYNGAGYINAGFLDPVNPGPFILSAELVSGLAPSWTFVGGVGMGSLGTANAVAWSLAGSLPGDPTISTADLWVDPASGDTHVLARSASGKLVYLYRSSAGAWAAPVVASPSSYLGRFVMTGGRLFVAHDVSGMGLVVQELALTSGGGPLDWTTSTPVSVPLPAGYQNLYAIYPETDTYQTTPVNGVNLGIVSSTKDSEVMGVFATPP